MSCKLHAGDDHFLILHFSLASPAEVSVCGHQIGAAHGPRREPSADDTVCMICVAWNFHRTMLEKVRMGQYLTCLVEVWPTLICMPILLGNLNHSVRVCVCPWTIPNGWIESHDHGSWLPAVSLLKPHMTWGTALGGSEHVNMGQTPDTFVSRKWVKLPLDVLFPSVTMTGTAAVVHLGESWQSWGWLHLKHDVYDYARVCMIMFDYVCMFDHICMILYESLHVLICRIKTQLPSSQSMTSGPPPAARSLA